ncbi:nuclear transport factor 2 family protein [Nonomuraea dietziae]|uniref:Outer membrane murein-binding lipoprotein Lpp n=1 Tax=Nonomuraea dietziae TaxID=65515 RepID=A0A7W5YRF5_9ACTN|nr:nuclear transport factor 2 family protein [Nonomuraea dietziae]MBB3730822.1 outer membrane murein-binding lipoprotein Lpp [Nonomuraea dietziae]
MRRRTALLLGGAAVLVIAGGVSMAAVDRQGPAAQTLVTTTAQAQAATTAQPQAATTAQAPADLDPAARRYVDAVAAEDLDALVASFTPDAVIVDVGREIRGHDAIRHWADTEVIGGRLTVLGNTPRRGGTTMLVTFAPGGTGGFRASYSFDISGGLITRATLQYA